LDKVEPSIANVPMNIGVNSFRASRRSRPLTSFSLAFKRAFLAMALALLLFVLSSSFVGVVDGGGDDGDDVEDVIGIEL